MTTLRLLAAHGSQGVWMMATLAHHAHNSGEWIAIMNEVEGLVAMAAHAASTLEEPTETTIRHARAILMALLKVYETLRQCDEGGFISRTLAHKYDKPVRALLRQEWAQQVAVLKLDISTHAMELLIHARTMRAKSGCVRLVLDRAMTSDRRALDTALAPLERHEQLQRDADRILAAKFDVGKPMSPRAASGAPWRPRPHEAPPLTQLPSWLGTQPVDADEVESAVRRRGADYDQERRWSFVRARLNSIAAMSASLTRFERLQVPGRAASAPDGPLMAP